MDEKKQKVQRANSVLDNFIKSKRSGTPAKSDYSSLTEHPYETASSHTGKHAQDRERSVLKLDSPTLKKKTDLFDSLSKKIKQLQDELSEKTERVLALEVENEVLRKGQGDGLGVAPQDTLMIKDLQKMVDARDTFIKQLSDSLQKRSEELQTSVQREKELVEEIQSLQQNFNSLTKQTELKLSEAYSEGVEYRAKVELMSSQMQEYSVLVQSLRTTLENNNKELMAKKEEVDIKERKLEKYKSEVSADVKTLMRQVENLNHDLSKKEKELIKSKKEVESIRSQMEEQFGAEIKALKEKLENKYAEDIKKVEMLYDGMLLEHIRKTDSQMKTVGECTQLEDKIKAIIELHENEKITYREEVQALLEKNKETEVKLTLELEKYKQEADHYRQQVDNFENKVAEEVRKIQRECFKELDQYENEMKLEQNKYEAEIKKLAKRLKDIAVIEAKKEVELETYKNELIKLQKHVLSVEELLNKSKEDLERQRSQFLAQLNEFRSNESKLMQELTISRAKVHEYESKVYEFNEDFKDKSTDFNQKYQNVVHSFEQQIQNLMSELERTKTQYEDEKSHYASVVNEKENLIKNLEAKLEYLNTLQQKQANETQGKQDSIQELTEQINTLRKNLTLAEKYEKSNTEFLSKALGELKEVKKVVCRLAGMEIEESVMNANTGNGDHVEIVNELEKTINDIMNVTQSVDAKNTSQQGMPDIHTSTPMGNESININDPGNDLVRKCELLEAENIKLTKKLEFLAVHMKEMEYCFYVASKESIIFDQKCKDLDSKITELEKLKFSEHMLKKENNELKERLAVVEESERNVRKEVEELTEKNVKLEKTLNKSLADLHQEVANNGPNINLEAVLSDLKTKSEEVLRLRSQLSAVQNALKDNQEKMMQLKGQCDKFIAQHEFMMSEIKTKQKELEDVWKERNELSTENKMLQSKLLSCQGRNNWQLHKIPSSIRSSSTSTGTETGGFLLSESLSKDLEERNVPSAESDDDISDYHVKRLQTMHLLTESISMSSKTNILDSTSNLSVASRIDLELQQLDEMFNESDNLYMPTITEEDEEFPDEVRVFFEQMAQGDQNIGGKEKDDSCTASKTRRRIILRGPWVVALRQLLKTLFSEYATHVKKMLLPWLEECETLDVSLLNDLEITSSRKYSKQKQDNKPDQGESSSIVRDSFSENVSSHEFVRLLIEHCIRSLFFLKKRLINAHNAVMKTIRIQQSELDKSCLILELQDQLRALESEKNELEKKHKSAMELLVKDHETELSLAKNLLAKLQDKNSVVVSEDLETIRRDLEKKHRKEVEELRTYFEKKCADLEKHYSEEIYSQSQHNSKVSMSSCSSDVGNIVDLYEDEPPNQMECDESLHKGCEKKVVELRELLENMQEKYKGELDSVKSSCELRLSESVCKMCKKNLTNGEESREKQSGITLEQYYTEKIQDLDEKYPATNASKDLELKVYQIKEEVRKDYELELDKIREDIVAKELKRKDEEIKLIKAQLNEAHRIEIEKLWRRYEELASKEVENSVIRVKNEVILTQELEEKSKYIEQLKHDKKELFKKLNTMNEQKSKEIEQVRGDMQRAHKKEIENMKQAFEIELTTRIDTVMEEKMEMETNYKKQIEKLQENVRSLHIEKEKLQKNEQELHSLTDEVRKEIVRALELQIKAMVESGDEGEDKSSWPPELAALERQFTSKYQEQLAQLVEEHALELAELRAEYDAKLSQFVREYSLKQAEEMPIAMITTGDQDLDKVMRERDNLRNLTLTLRRVVQELANYLTTCEDELNKSIVGELVKLASPYRGNRVQISQVDSDTSDSEPQPELQRRVHFAPDVSHIVSLMDEDHLFDASGSLDLSVHFHTELETCLERLRDEAATLLGLSQGRDTLMPSTVEDRRMSSLTRQLIEEKKAKEEANRRVQELEELVSKYEKELNDVHRELTDTKDRMIREKVAAETEFSERQTEQRAQNLCYLQEKARVMVGERGECPAVWLGLVEELCSEGDAMLEDAWRERDELKLEVEAADKQLRSTRAFLEEQAVDREQERDEAAREIARLTELLRERERETTNHRHYASEFMLAPPPQGNDAAVVRSQRDVDALELQVKELSEQLKETEEKKIHFEKEYKTAVDKVWTLREIIAELEMQVTRHCEREAALEAQLAVTQTELTAQTRGYADTLQQLCSLRDCGDADSSTQDEGQDRPILSQLKSQLRTLAKSIQRQIKELEAVNIHVSTASLSSPSEDVSIRDTLEARRCLTPDGPSPSPTSPPLEELELLSERLLRYSRAAENLIKKLRDRDLQIDSMRAQNEELQTERDVLQGQSERALMQVASLTNKVEELRVRSDKEITAATQPLTQRLLQLEQEANDKADELREAQRKLGKLKQKLERSESIIQNQEAKIRNMSDHQHELVEKLSKDLETMRTEKQQLQAMVEKYRTEDNVSFPQLIEVMLAEKNADIDQLQQRVEELASRQDQSSKSRGLRVSFADSVAQSQLGEGERLRDMQLDHSSLRPIFSTPFSSVEEGGSRLLPRVLGGDLSKIPEPAMPQLQLFTSPNRADQLESVLSQLKSELEQKTQRLIECEAQLHELASIKQKLDEANEQLQSMEEVKQLLAEREKELAEVRADLALKEEDNVKTTADVKALQDIMEGLQHKLKEAKSFAEIYENNPNLDELKEINNKYKEECDSYKKTIDDLEIEISEVKQALSNEKETRENLHKIVAKLETDKQNILSDLVLTKSRCKSLQEELEAAIRTAGENCEKIESLKKALEESQKENSKLTTDYQHMRKEIEQLSRKQKVEMKNMLRKDSEEAGKIKDQLERLKSSNSELLAENESLRTKLEEVSNSLRSLLSEINDKDDKLQQLENELKHLDENYKMLKNDKAATEQSLKNEIAVLKILRDDLNRNLESLETQTKEQVSISDKEDVDSLKRKYESLKREYERQRRARRESQKKCSVLKNELMKEKEFSAHLRNKSNESKLHQLVITKTNLVDIRGEGSTLSNSLDDLTDEVQKQLNASAQLDQTLLSELQSKTETKEVQVGRSEVMPPRTDFLTSRLAEVETELRVERVVVSELRARLAEERGRYLCERERVATLREEVASLQTLNNQLEDRFREIAYQLEQQVNGVKQLMKGEPSDQEKELRRLLEETQRRVEELTQERGFAQNQLQYLREELTKARQPTISSSQDCLQQERSRIATLQQMLDQANLNMERVASELQAKADDLRNQLDIEQGLRKTLESKIKAMELAERSKHIRRKASEEKLKDQLIQAEKTKRELERECLRLQLAIKQQQLQLRTRDDESPLALRLREANVTVERLVGEKEDLLAANTILKEEKEDLLKKRREQEELIEDLKSRINALNIKVVDGGVDNLNAMFASERAAWLRERDALKQALAQAQSCAGSSVDTFNGYTNSTHLLQKYLRAESHRKALVWQKRYLMISLSGYQAEERQTVAALYRFPAPSPPPPATPEHRFRVAVCAVRVVFRMRFLMEHRKRTYDNTCRVLQRALSSTRSAPYTAESISDFQLLWQRNNVPSTSQPLQPGSIAQYIDRFNAMQDKIKNALSTTS